MYFFTAQNRKCWELRESIEEAYKEALCEKKGVNSNNPDQLKEKVDALEVIVAYANLVIENNIEIMKILKEKYFLIDPDDVEIFQQFVIDYVRRTAEFDKGASPKLPAAINGHLAESSFFFPDDFINRVKNKFISKKFEIDSLYR